MADEAHIGRTGTSGDTLRLALDSLVDHAFATLDPQGMVTSWNSGAERLFGWSREETVGLPISAVFRVEGHESGIGTVELEQAAERGVVMGRRRLTCADGGTTDADTTIRALRADGGLMGYVVLAYHASAAPTASSGAVNDTVPDETRRQLSESKTLLAAEIVDRTQAEASRERLLRRLVVAQEDERRRLARELHDGLGQRLTALRLSLEALENGPADQQPQIAAAALETLGRIDQDVDFIAWELRPAALDELGLVKVLDTYVREWSRHTGVAAQFHSRPGRLERFAPEVEASVYRIAQEALNNVAKHADARSVNVLLDVRGDTLALVVEDDGRGFQHGAIGETRIGLSGMRERAMAVGGSVEIEPTAGGGTTILANIPTTGAHRDRSSLAGAAGNLSRQRGAIENGTTEWSDEAGLAQSAIRTRLQELQRAVGARDEFIATVAHELRNPIAPLTFQVRIALTKIEQMTAAGTTVPTDWVQSQLRGMEQRLHRLLETLDRLLDVSRLSTGRIDLQPEPMNLANVVRDVMSTLEAEFAVARCKVAWSDQGNATGTWDRLRVEQICRNLLSNACRFGAGHPIEVSVSADQDFAMLRVRDHGVGIPADQHARIFERFERGVEQRSGGFGIGLWIVRNICVAMGGTVTVQSELENGACFTVMLPRSPSRPTGSAELESRW